MSLQNENDQPEHIEFPEHPQWRLSCFKRAEIKRREAKKNKKQFDSADYFMEHPSIKNLTENGVVQKKSFPRISKDKKIIFDSADHFMEQQAQAQIEQRAQQIQAQAQKRNPLVHKSKGRKIFDSADYFMEVQHKN
jgi:hypothetical protein